MAAEGSGLGHRLPQAPHKVGSFNCHHRGSLTVAVQRYLDPEVKGRSELGYLWVYLDPGGEVLFQWSTGRAHKAPKDVLGDYRGILQVDGYGAYEALVRARGGPVSLVQ